VPPVSCLQIYCSDSKVPLHCPPVVPCTPKVKESFHIYNFSTHLSVELGGLEMLSMP
jgi:hypothetical protein